MKRCKNGQWHLSDDEMHDIAVFMQFFAEDSRTNVYVSAVIAEKAKKIFNVLEESNYKF